MLDASLRAYMQFAWEWWRASACEALSDDQLTEMEFNVLYAATMQPALLHLETPRALSPQPGTVFQQAVDRFGGFWVAPRRVDFPHEAP